MKNNFLFDLDGVVLNSMPYHFQAMYEACLKFGVEISKDLVFQNEGAITYDLLKEIFQKYGISLNKQNYIDIINNHKKLFIEKYSKEVKPFDYILEIFYGLKKNNKKIAIVTGSYKEIVDKDLPTEIKNIVDVIITSDVINNRKPHPEPYQKALYLLKADTSNSIVIENSPAGILSAKNAGLFCIALTTTLPKEKLYFADIILENHLQLKKYFLQNNFFQDIDK